nr:hypothetical protein GCM10020093_053800 [Planobispora longispora]
MTGGELVLALSQGEKVAGLHGDIRMPRAAVREVAVVENAVADARGLRSPAWPCRDGPRSGPGGARAAGPSWSPAGTCPPYG